MSNWTFEEDLRPRWLKIGIEGRAGAGKTFSAFSLARGLCEREGASDRPVYILATEDGPEFQGHRLAVPPRILKTPKIRAEFRGHGDGPSDWEILRRGAAIVRRELPPVFIVDSFTHCWDAFQKDSGVTETKSARDWAEPKKKLREFFRFMAELPVHVIILMRSANEYEEQVNPRTGQKQMVKVGDKAKTEGSLFHDLSLILEARSPAPGEYETLVKRDRSDHYNGQTIARPSFASFARVWDMVAWPEPAPAAGQRAAREAPQGPTEGRGGPEATGAGETPPAGPEEAPMETPFDGLKLRRGWQWPATAAPYEGPHDGRFSDDEERLLVDCQARDREAGIHLRPGEIGLHCVAVMAFKAGWTGVEFAKYVPMDKFMSAPEKTRDGLHRWLVDCSKARQEFHEERKAA